MTPEPSFGVILGKGFRLITRLVRAHPWAFTIAFFGSLVYSGSIIASSRVVGWVTDEVILGILEGDAPGRLVWTGVWALLAVATVKASGIVARRVGGGWLQLRNRQDLRRAFVRQVLDLDMHWYNRQAVGNLISVAEADVTQATSLLAPLPYALGSMLLLVGSSVLVFALDPTLGWIALVFLMVTMVFELHGAYRTFPLEARVQHSRGTLAAVAHESFDGALTVKAFGREQWETDRFAHESGTLRDRLVRVGRIWENYKTLVQTIPTVAQVVIVTVGVLRVADGAVSGGDVVSVAYLLTLLLWPIQLIGFLIFDIAASTAAWDRVEQVLEVQAHVRHGTAPTNPSGTGAGVAVSGVGFSYADTPVLDDLALDIRPGAVVAIVGPTGSGKTTLTLLLARLWDPDTGSLHLDGRDLRDLGVGALTSEIAYVPQEAFLFDDTVAGNLTLGLPIRDDALRDAAVLARADRFIEQLPDGYETRIGERGASLSGGQRQRIALARALLRRPRLLVLDDATSAVDPTVEAEILTSLRSADLPSTVVVVAYRSSTIALADEVVFMEAGRVVAQGSHAELLATQPGYARLLTAYETDAAQREARR